MNRFVYMYVWMHGVYVRVVAIINAKQIWLDFNLYVYACVLSVIRYSFILYYYYIYYNNLI